MTLRYVSVEVLSRISGFSPLTIRVHLRKLGITEKIDGRIHVSREKLRESWPSMHELLLSLELQA